MFRCLVTTFSLSSQLDLSCCAHCSIGAPSVHWIQFRPADTTTFSQVSTYAAAELPQPTTSPSLMRHPSQARTPINLVLLPWGAGLKSLGCMGLFMDQVDRACMMIMMRGDFLPYVPWFSLWWYRSTNSRFRWLYGTDLNSWNRLGQFLFQLVSCLLSWTGNRYIYCRNT